MNKSPIISVIIPCYNAEQYLKEALLSIINQTYKNLEILLIDDGSTDKSAVIYNGFSKDDERVKIFKNETNLGLIETLNKGIDLATGEYIARMDADDVSILNRLEKQLKFFEKQPELSIVGTAAIAIDENGQQNKQRTNTTYTEFNTLKFSSYFSQPLFHGSVLAKASVFKNNKYSMEYKHSEDFELWLRLISGGHKMANIAEPCYLYRNNSQGVSNNNASFQSEKHNQASAKYLEKLLKRTLDKQLVSIVNNRPEQRVPIQDFKRAIQLFSEILKIIDPQKSNELMLYFKRQKVDITIQAFRNASGFSAKLYFSLFLMRQLTSKKASNYMLSKFGGKS